MKEKKKEEEISDTSNIPSDAIMHDNGVYYRVCNVDGLDDPIRLFNSYKPGRLDDETKVEYRIRRTFLKHKENNVVNLFYNPYENSINNGYTKGVPYVNKNKKNKFKK